MSEYQYYEFCKSWKYFYSKEILLNYFDVYFYISNFGVMELFFKYKNEDIDVEAISKNCSKDVINLVKYGQYSILKIRINKEEGCGWIEGDGLLADLLSLYDEIKNKSYQSLELISAIDYDLNNEGEYLSAFIKDKELTEGQQALVDCMKLFSY